VTDCQRWRDRRESYRPAREVIRTSEYDIAAITGSGGDTIARDFVEQHHYSGSYPSALERFGLYRRGELAGVVVFSYPTNDLALTNFFPELKVGVESMELGRLVLLDEVGANAESYFVARCFEQLRAIGVRGIRSDSDPVARATADGRVVTPGHVGTVYQALNGRYVGLGTARTLYILPDGTALSARAMQKIRKAEKGWRAAAAALSRAVDAEAIDAAADAGARRAWLLAATKQLRRIRHPGNHRYLWSLDRRVRMSLPAPAPAYPKRRVA
jgi:hypothetical protein